MDRSRSGRPRSSYPHPSRRRRVARAVWRAPRARWCRWSCWAWSRSPLRRTSWRGSYRAMPSAWTSARPSGPPRMRCCMATTRIPHSTRRRSPSGWPTPTRPSWRSSWRRSACCRSASRPPSPCSRRSPRSSGRCGSRASGIGAATARRWHRPSSSSASRPRRCRPSSRSPLPWRGATGARGLATPLLIAAVIAAKLFLWPLLVWLAIVRGTRCAVLTALAAVGVIVAPWLAGFPGAREYLPLLSKLTELEGAYAYTAALARALAGRRLAHGRGACDRGRRGRRSSPPSRSAAGSMQIAARWR